MEANDIPIGATTLASARLQAGDAKAMLKDASKLIAMKGKKVEEFDVKGKVGSDAVAAMLGPTGNMRAPTIRSGKTLLVGFNDEVFKGHFG